MDSAKPGQQILEQDPVKQIEKKKRNKTKLHEMQGNRKVINNQQLVLI